MLRFLEPSFLYLLLFLPLLVGVYYIYALRTHRRLRRLGTPHLLKSLVPNRSSHRSWVKFSLTLLALGSLIVILARPQTGLKEAEEKKQSIEICFLVDVSNSMLAEDVSPNRLEKAKILIARMMDQFPNDKISLGVFAGEAYPQLPMTSDHIAAKMFLDALSPEMVTLQGTDIAAAIALGKQSFSVHHKGGKAIVLITDAENHEEGAEAKAANLAEEGIALYVLGVGTKEGGRIPTHEGFLTDEQGVVVTTSLNEVVAQRLAEQGKGKYIYAKTGNDAGEELKLALQDFKRTESVVVYAEYREEYALFAVIALLLLLTEFLLSETRSTWLNRWHLFQRNTPKDNDAL